MPPIEVIPILFNPNQIEQMLSTQVENYTTAPQKGAVCNLCKSVEKERHEKQQENKKELEKETQRLQTRDKRRKKKRIYIPSIRILDTYI